MFSEDVRQEGGSYQTDGDVVAGGNVMAGEVSLRKHSHRGRLGQIIT